MTPAPSLQELIESVNNDASSDDALDRLTQAARTAASLEEVGDALLGHFVDQSRRSGRTWSQISVALGVTKQAAHKRFSFGAATFDTGSPTLERFTPRAKAALHDAAEHARRRGHEHVGTDDLLLALFEPSGAVAAKALREAGITRESCEGQLPAAEPADTARSSGDARPFNDPAKDALRSAVEEALRLQHNYVGTEHLLLGLYFDPQDPAARALAALGAGYEDIKGRIAEQLGKMAA